MYRFLIFSLLLIGVSAIQDQLLLEYEKDYPSSRIMDRDSTIYDEVLTPESNTFDGFKVMVIILILSAIFELIVRCDLHYGTNY